ncbi:MAG: gliding motility-associated C-terminal domain-containing protein [Bacteroidetes bacterium]|nr:gliding motility-associated C-terminal domain-containing protein [Bacteroidota bacterium]
MKQYYKPITLLLTLLPVVFLKAQTVNTGELVVSKGTVLSTVEELNNTQTATLINDGDLFVYSHWNNDGTVDHNNSGLTRFIGNSPQVISGDGISYLYNILFDNPSSQPAFELSGELSIGNEADFDIGIVDNDNFGGSFTFEQFADHIGTTDDSHVDGQVIKVGDNSFNYPIGDAGLYRYAEISAPDGAGDVFTGKYFFENPNANYPLANNSGVIELVNNQEYWTITRDSGTSGILLTLSWEEGTTTPEEIVKAPQSAIHIVRWDEEQQLWVDEGGVVDIDNKTATTPLQLDAYGVFTLARVKEEFILPGDVVIYNGVTPNDDGKNDYFIIDGIQNLANNSVEIINRWGVKVFETSNYDTNGNVFKGFSEGRLTINGDELLPTGTYFYVLNYDYTSNGITRRIKQAGYLYLNAD